MTHLCNDNFAWQRTMQRKRTIRVFHREYADHSNSSKFTKPARRRGGACCFNKAILASLARSFGGLGNMVLRMEGILNFRSIGLQPGMTESRLAAGTTSMRRHKRFTSVFISFGISSRMSCCLAVIPLRSWSPLRSASISSTIPTALS